MTELTLEQKRANREAWAKDLEANGELQGKNVLEQHGQFCCLGRLAVLAGCRRTEEGAGIITFDGDSLEAPARATAWVGLRDASGHYGRVSLTHLNDTGTTFAEIAAIIRAEPEGLFDE